MNGWMPMRAESPMRRIQAFENLFGNGAGSGRLATNARSADVRTNIFSVACATALAALVCFNTAAFGQQPPMNGGVPQMQPAGMPQGQPGGAVARPVAAGAPIGINGMAVVDVAYIFKNHTRFKQQMDGMKAKVDAAENDVKQVQTEMKAMVEQMKAFSPGTPDYKRVEADLLKKQGELQVRVNLQKKDFMEQEGKIYYNISLEVEDAVKRLATKNNIALVLRFNGDQVDAANRDDILRNINKPIVFYDPRMDITPYILQDLNRPSGGAGPVGVRPAGPGMQAPR
jgi:Skp family chaperone for outer membrane proteins